MVFKRAGKNESKKKRIIFCKYSGSLRRMSNEFFSLRVYLELNTKIIILIIVNTS